MFYSYMFHKQSDFGFSGHTNTLIEGLWELINYFSINDTNFELCENKYWPFKVYKVGYGILDW